MTLMAIGALLVATLIYHHPELCPHPMDKATYAGVCIRQGILMAIAGLTVVLAGAARRRQLCLLLILGRPLSNLLTRRLHQVCAGSSRIALGPA